MILGGNGPTAIDVVAGDKIQNLRNYLVAGANYSNRSPGVIISYTVRYLKDNDVARVSSATDYTIRTTQISPQANPLTSLRVTWHTAGDNKDWDTQPVVEVFDLHGRRIGG
jgi:hypothetical protein